MFSDADNADASDGCARLDRWLWAVRVFKTRALATAACRGGEVEIGALAAKPARVVRPGEIVIVRQGVVTRTLHVVAVPRSRVGAKLVPAYADERTPAAEFAKAREQHIQHLLARPKGMGRPTKRDRRDIDRLFD